MTRVMVGDALVFENDRLQQRMNQFFSKVESALRQSLRAAAEENGLRHADSGCAGAGCGGDSLCIGRLQLFARSGFKRLPTEQLEASVALFL